MSIRCTQQGRTLRAQVSGELDHHRARETMQTLELAIAQARPTALLLDLSGLTFTDSSGIAVLLRARRQMTEIRGTLRVLHTPEQALRVFRAAGLERLIPFETEGEDT